MNIHKPEHTEAMAAQPTPDRGHSLNRIFTAVAVITGMLLAVLIALTPPGADDLLFLLPAKGCQPGPGLLDMMAGELPRIWETQSGRLGNFISMPFLYLVPKWIFGIITGTLTTILILLSCRLTGARRGSIVGWLIYASIVLAFPWYDYLTLVTYAVNYLWAAAAAAGAIACFLDIDKLRGWRLAGAYLLIFSAGWIHEGYGAPLTAGLTLCLIISFPKISRRRIWAWICCGAGTVMTAFSPVFWQRSEREFNFLLKFTYKELAMQVGPALLFVAAMISLLIWAASRRRTRTDILMKAPLLIFAGAAFASTAVFLKFYTGPRTGAPVILYSMLAYAYIVTAAARDRRCPTALQWAAAILIGGFSLLHLAYADISQTHRTKEYLEATRLYEDSADGTFYYDLAYPEPDLTLFKTSVRQFHEKVPLEFMRIYFKPEYKMVILPTAMKGFSPEKTTASGLTPGAMVYNGWIVLPDTADTDALQRIHILTEDGRYLPTRFRSDRFTYRDSITFQLITPHVKVLDPHIRVKDVVLRDNSR
ncbi:MAG: hypothetical protein HDS38_05070 [Bacteroides sp.]|nr:hypothetical protein [Bacteroides sp.]